MHRLYIIEGLPCSGKSTASAFVSAVIDYHINGEYGRSINAKGFDGYIKCLLERQKRELMILSELDVKSIVINNAQRDFEKAYERIREML